MKPIGLLLILMLTAHAYGQTQPVRTPEDHLRVFLLTFGPGAEPWEKFGHNAIAITDTETGESVAYNWGVFDFGQGWSGFTQFAWHFVQGRLVYSMESEPTQDMIDEYVQDKRSILAQELNLTPEQKIRLQSRLIANDTDANRYYLYDYFKKNCATMARDAIDQTVDGRARSALNTLPSGTTYRWHDRRTTADAWWLYLFLDLSLGHPVDRPLSKWEECFLPGELAEHLQVVRVPDAQGKWVPLIGEARQLNAGIFTERKEPPASCVYWLSLVGVSIGLVLGWLGTIGQRMKLARWAFNLFASIWSLLAGALGALLTFVWLTNHAAAKWNENWLQLNPLSLVLVILVPAARYLPKLERAIVLMVLCLSVLGVVAKVTPWAYQSNWTIIALALPIHAGIASGICRWPSSKSPCAITRQTP